MRPLHLNLAREPWRDTRPLWLTVGILTAAIILLMIANAHAAYRYFVETEETRARIAEVRAEAAEAAVAADENEKRLADTNQRLVDARVEFVNSRIRERAFSWSQLLDHLERVLPDEVKISALQPNVPDEGPVRLQMNLVAKNQQGFVDTVENLFTDSYFDQPVPTSESSRDGLVYFTLSVEYRPDPKGLVVSE